MFFNFFLFYPFFSPISWYPIVVVATILFHRYNSRTGSGETKVESHASSDTQHNQAALLLTNLLCYILIHSIHISTYLKGVSFQMVPRICTPLLQGLSYRQLDFRRKCNVLKMYTRVQCGSDGRPLPLQCQGCGFDSHGGPVWKNENLCAHYCKSLRIRVSDE